MNSRPAASRISDARPKMPVPVPARLVCAMPTRRLSSLTGCHVAYSSDDVGSRLKIMSVDTGRSPEIKARRQNDRAQTEASGTEEGK